MDGMKTASLFQASWMVAARSGLWLGDGFSPKLALALIVLAHLSSTLGQSDDY